MKTKSLTIRKKKALKSINKKIPWLTTKGVTPIAENSDLPKKAQEILQKRGIKLRYRDGDYVLNDRGDLLKVCGFTNKGFVTMSKWDGKWSTYGSEEWDKVGEMEYIKVDNPDTVDKDVLKFLSETTDLGDDEKKEESKETAIATLNKNMLKTYEETLVQKELKYQLMMRVLENKRHELMSIVDQWQKQLRRIRKVIGQIELYLGINEDIIQIQEGTPADIKELLSLRQQKLYMDEEVGIYEDGGLDIHDIEQFDDWILKDKHYETLLPEKKGIVIMQVRRKDKHYCDEWFTNFSLNQGNKNTYFLIRNGDNIYRIFAEYNMGERMFPKKKELDNYVKAINGERVEEDHFLDDDKAKDALTDYQQTFLIIQGLIDRTQILHPMTERINIFNPKHHDKFIRYIYDDEVESQIHTGRKYFAEWQKEINEKIVRGTRVYFAGFDRDEYQTDRYTNRHDRIPSQHADPPKEGVYSVEFTKQINRYWSGSETSEALVCLYAPDNKVVTNWGYDARDRKNRMSFYLYRTDDFILNYDLMTLEDVDYYIKNRYERRNYLSMMPVLKQIRSARIQELKWERGFVDMMKLEFNCSEKVIWEAINWWKHKVIWKRPLTKDDAKAVRMIKKRLSRGFKK